MRNFTTEYAVVSDFLLIFANKFNDKNRDMQENEVKNGAITIEGYYATLSKKEKSQLIHFLMEKYGFCYCTIQQKLTGRTKFNPRDLLVVQTVINQSLWKSK